MIPGTTKPIVTRVRGANLLTWIVFAVLQCQLFAVGKDYLFEPQDMRAVLGEIARDRDLIPWFQRIFSPSDPVSPKGLTDSTMELFVLCPPCYLHRYRFEHGDLSIGRSLQFPLRSSSLKCRKTPHRGAQRRGPRPENENSSPSRGAC